MSTETKTVTLTFKDVQKEIDQIPFINNGGCGIAALAMVRWIKKYAYDQMTYLFVMGHNDVGSFKLNAAIVANATKLEPTSANHIGPIIYDHLNNKQMIVDSTATYNMLNYDYVNTFRDERILLKAINQVDHWNPVFNRGNVDIIAKSLNINLSDVDCRTGTEYQNSIKVHPKSPKGVQWKDAIVSVKKGFMSLKAEYLKKFLKLIKL